MCGCYACALTSYLASNIGHQLVCPSIIEALCCVVGITLFSSYNFLYDWIFSLQSTLA